MIFKIKASCQTDASSLWSGKIAKVFHSEMELDEMPPDADEGETESNFGELRVYFKSRSWNPNREGLIYTDKGWISDFKKYLKSIKFSDESLNNLSYSEHGMQGLDYVSMDCGGVFIKEYLGLLK